MQMLCKDCPKEFLLYMEYCKGLDFIQKPDYSFLRVLMKSIANRERLDLDIECFDWCLVLGQKSPKYNVL